MPYKKSEDKAVSLTGGEFILSSCSGRKSVRKSMAAFLEHLLKTDNNSEGIYPAPLRLEKVYLGLAQNVQVLTRLRNMILKSLWEL